MTLYDLARKIPFHHDFLDLYGDCEIRPENWREEDGKIVLDLAEIKRMAND